MSHTYLPQRINSPNSLLTILQTLKTLYHFQYGGDTTSTSYQTSHEILTKSSQPPQFFSCIERNEAIPVAIFVLLVPAFPPSVNPVILIYHANLKNELGIFTSSVWVQDSQGRNGHTLNSSKMPEEFVIDWQKYARWGRYPMDCSWSISSTESISQYQMEKEINTRQRCLVSASVVQRCQRSL